MIRHYYVRDEHAGNLFSACGVVLPDHITNVKRAVTCKRCQKVLKGKTK